MEEKAQKWVTIFQHFVSLVSDSHKVADPNALLAYMLVNYMKKACHVLFSIHFEEPWERELMQKMKIGHDKRKLIFFILKSFFKEIF